MASIRLALLVLLALPFAACELEEGSLASVETATSDRVEAAPAPSAPPGVGDIAPDFALLDSEGRTVRLADALGQRVVLVFYRAHW